MPKQYNLYLVHSEKLFLIRKWNRCLALAAMPSDECTASSCICLSCQGPNPMIARYIYGILFLLTNILAWTTRDYSQRALTDLHHLKRCEDDANCLGSESVLRLSFGCFMFFFVMFMTTVGTSRKDDPRDRWHSGWWPVKSILWITFTIVPFFLPSVVIQLYGEIARFGAGIFLLVQLLSIINFVYLWNESWMSPEHERQCYIPLVVVPMTCYILTFIGLVLMYVWFTPHVTCRLNIFFITWTMILVIVMTIISLHAKVNAGLLTSGVMSLYLIFLCWSAIMSEPLSASCNTRERQTGKADWLTIISFLIAFLAIVFATYTTGIDSEAFSFKKKDESKDDGSLPYSYGFFHFVFALGAMYLAMLFVGWNLHQTMHKWSIDIGWASVWVKIVNQWLAAIIYGWTMIGPFVLKNRDFSS
ncbi:uncharacterized protein [Physcomitrium patens]|uniref:Serine incorporator n=1 Tax=Physcomitrium patens TaxID=3218 RepID=A0A7I4ASS4_PHYPA|nr:probable serine incorporator isoform X1 [Physcomitrium patens]|eukprot:XP_024393737.1 probable serine incorporator isoform X1 [Physcomitrella patens]